MGRRYNKKRSNKNKSRDGVDDRDKPQWRDDHKTYKNIVKENEAFETYYKAQNLVKSEEEWNEFLNTMRKPLPAAFRINGFCFGQTQALKNIVESPEFGNLTRAPVNSQNENNSASEVGESKILPLPWYPNGLAYQMKLSRVEIRRAEGLQKLHSFLVSESENGYISRQEAVSMIPPMVLDIQPHHKVLDLCAAPGSKTAQIIEFLHANDADSFGEHGNDNSELMNGLVVANDVENNRCYMLVHQSKRLNSPSFVICNHDAGSIPSFYKQGEVKEKLKFDRIVCDVPCSGDGTIRKNIDVWTKWNVANGNNFNGLQTRIAKRALELLSKDGLMVYSTCSFNPMENEAVVSTLLNEAQGALELVDISDKLNAFKYIPGLETWKLMRKNLTVVDSYDQVEESLRTQLRANMFPPTNVKDLNLTRCVRVLPHLQDTGGFFIALLRKKTDSMPWEKTDEEPKETQTTLENPPAKKQRVDRRTGGFKEDPFFFFKEEDEEWTLIKNYYAISDRFPYTQLMYRSEKISRNIYYLTKSAKELIVANEGRVKFINAGVRMFSRIQDKVANCPYRITQEGLAILYPFMKKSNIVDVTKNEFHMILSAEEFVDNTNLSEPTQARLAEVASGCCIIQHREMVKNEQGIEKEMLLPISAWKGKLTTRPYICKSERLHYLRICGFDLSEFENEQKRHFAERQARRNERISTKESTGEGLSESVEST